MKVCESNFTIEDYYRGANVETKTRSAKPCGDVRIIESFIEILLITRFIVWLC